MNEQILKNIVIVLKRDNDNGGYGTFNDVGFGCKK